MKTILNRRILGVFIVVASLVVTSTSFAALNAYLKLKRSDGKTYSCTCDAGGNFKFLNVEPGTYKLLWVVGQGEGSLSEPSSIEISSFSWGATNTGSMLSSEQAKSTQVTRSNISNNRTAGTVETGAADATSQPVTKSSSNIQNNLTTGGGTGKVSVQDLHYTCTSSQVSKSGTDNFVIVLEDVVVSSVTSPSGKIGSMRATWDLAKGTK
ncbi:MAG: hypothetical protein ABI778_05050 [Ignavibacteriota bacterium]